ncbi:MAG: hypothetical protein ACI9S8_001855 [Chlamydiales bacterium]|jgi:hypothetical protein
MKTLFIANTDFEFELTRKQTLGLKQALEQSPLTMQLQFLPLIYLPEEDAVGLTMLPNPSYLSYLEVVRGSPLPRLYCFDEITTKSPIHQVKSWGHSLQVTKWSQKNHLTYQMPAWDCIVKVNSKAFSFEISPKLPGAKLLKSFEELNDWISESPSTKVIKGCFGVAGRENFILESPENKASKQLSSFLHSQWKKGLPVIGEPWMDRQLDFSTQWEITPAGDIHYLGATVMENDSEGHYIKTITGPEEVVFSKVFWALEKQKEFSYKILERIKGEGFFGNIGIDAMLYNLPCCQDETRLHPVVEINARQTMGYIALCFQKLRYPENCVCLEYAPSNKIGESLLPSFLPKSDGSTQKFSRQLRFELSKHPPVGLI